MRAGAAPSSGEGLKLSTLSQNKLDSDKMSITKV